VASGLDVIRGPPSISPIPSDQEILPPAGIEREAFLQEVRNDITRINDVMKNLVTVFSIEPIFIELLKEDGEKSKTSEEVFQEAYDALESMFFLH
jgi:hypothetical protein